MKNLFFFAFLISFTSLFANNSKVINETLEWNIGVKAVNIEEGRNIYIHSFKNALYSDEHPTLPLYQNRYKVSSYGTLSASFTATSFEPITDVRGIDEKKIGERIEISAIVSIDRRQPYANISFYPIRKNPTTGSFERLVSFQLSVNHTAIQLGVTRSNPTNSILSSGTIYKIPVNSTGVHQLSYDYLSNMGVPVESIDPRQIKLYGNGGGMLPESNAIQRIDDLYENAIYIEGENDASFDSGDFLLFYAEGPNKWTYNDAANGFRMQQHLYDDFNYYFLQINGGTGTGKRISEIPSISNTTYTSSEFDDYAHFEEDEVNLFAEEDATSGSGKFWFGPTFKFTNERTYDFSFPNLVSGEQVELTWEVAARAVGGGSHKFEVSLAGTTVSENLGGVSGGIYNTYAVQEGDTRNFNVTGDDLQVKLKYIKPNSTAEGWLDYLELNVRRNLNLVGDQMIFRDTEVLAYSTASFQVADASSDLQVWDVRNPLDPARQAYSLSGSTLSFGFQVSDMPEFVAFRTSGAIVPETGTEIANQNLHNLVAPELLVLYHPSLLSAVNRYVDHRTSHSNITVTPVPIQKVYNEFSSGSQDVTAIRDFVKHLYDQPNSQLKHLLLFGDASFDFKNNYDNPDNNNLVPTYETDRPELNSLYSFPSDDYFTMLDNNEGGSISIGTMDVGVGRFPVRNLSEAEGVVSKLIHYETSPECLGDWRNRILFNADDEDSNTHLTDADGIAEVVRNNYKLYNLEKLYFDAFNQESTAGGNRYPDVSEGIKNNVGFKGDLVVNYMGHGNPNSWAQERVFHIDEAKLWTNLNRLPLFVTATCTFGPYDDPLEHSAGELLFTKPDGGAIALFTTVRAVFASTNEQLTRAVFSNIFEPINGEMPTLGDIMMDSKNAQTQSSTITNGRKFTLFGDPTMRLPSPDFDVVTTTINGQPIASADTIKALQEVTIEGFIAAADGSVKTDFNGTIQPTLFDKGKMVRTLVNDPASKLDSFYLQKNIIFKGRASVTDGRFSFTFTVPTDIDYSYGNGKLSYYADNGDDLEAGGYEEGLIIGGTSPNAVQDNQAPIVEVFMNNEEFSFGGITDENPVLLAKISDDTGINTIGTGIGHDLTGVLDEKTTKTYVLNDYYESELDNSKKGEVRYPLSGLAEGLHTIRVKAWDISNNSGEEFTEFLVASSANVAISQLLNYPNPFTDRTRFEFEHNLPNQPITVQVQIFTVAGRLVKTIHEEVLSEGYTVRGVEWDGRDDYGDKIGRGVYLYKVRIGSLNGEGDLNSGSSDFEKLVILK